MLYFDKIDQSYGSNLTLNGPDLYAEMTFGHQNYGLAAVGRCFSSDRSFPCDKIK